MRSLLDKFFDTWGELSAWNQVGLAFVGAVIVIALLWLLF